jgi:hypothetical protein
MSLMPYSLQLLHYPEDGDRTSHQNVGKHIYEYTQHHIPDDLYIYMNYTEFVQDIIHSQADFCKHIDQVLSYVIAHF